MPDGTQVIFDTNLGTIREKVVTTRSGLAQATIVSSSLPGVARVRASAFRFNAVGEIEVEFVADRSLLSTAREFIEVVGKDTLQYSVEDRILEATGENGGVFLKYRDIEITADDLQLNVPTYEVTARRVTLKVGDKYVLHLDKLYFKLNRRKGYGIGAHMELAPDPEGSHWPAGVPVKRVLKYGQVAMTSTGYGEPTEDFDRRLMDYRDISGAISIIEAKKAIAFPRKEVQFQSANVTMTGISVMKVPLFRVSVHTASPLITEQFINVSNNQLAVNYPYYLSLKPGQTSALRLRYGNRYGVGAGATGGMYLDYEMNWNRGDEMDGGMTVYGLARDDWGVGLRQSFAFADSTTLNAQLDFPAHKSLFGAVSVSKPFDGFSTSLNGTYGQSLAGSRFQSQSANLVIEKDPIKVNAIPGDLYIGLTASQTRITGESFSSSQDNVGLQARFVSDTFRFDQQNSMSFSYTLNQRSGSNTTSGLSQQALVNFSSTQIPGMVVNLGYHFNSDPFLSGILGQHSLNAETFYSVGDLSFSGFLSQALDVDRTTSNARLRYKLGDLWRFNYNYYFDQFGVDSFFDQTFILSYKIGFRELGISYSSRTKRFGLEILGTSFN